MQRFALITALLAVSALPAMAQSANGSWGCRDTDARDAGILTIYGPVYGFASTAYGDPASGTGTMTVYTDGVAFEAGPLMVEKGIEAGRLVADPSYGTAIQLETSQAVAMLCTPIGP
ncbi:hypothetical protein GCM10007989_10650 [Devosia pacifica]|uniref:Uncharacterized protein n=1 Tax=Devosia pacifica TaxID=1335967 RepID=A0A918VPI5_9HYPH|nr:hypothetical protein [Devosia pacifica]GHA17331.1 hypothetical protein GCM10007989_10650 [Devosia pacifica]